MAAVSTPHPSLHALDGRRFDGIVLECGKTAGDADTLSFEQGRFRSSACDRYGYGDGAYTASVASTGEIAFECETESPKYGLLRWRGVVRGPRMDATLTMVRDGVASGEKWILAGQV
ncbi:MAG TPA: hypothetical protein VGP22_14510 [Albitalea sp.]|jgi:hypothetical protein|nr:hypothetical protein [Albitalea sp.]